MRDPQLAAALAERRGGAPGGPPRRPGCYRAALSAGADGAALATQLADALALAGDCAAAAARPTICWAPPTPRERAAAVRIAASVATHDGNTGQAAELFGWLASGAGPRDAAVSAAGVIVLVATGDAAAARDAGRRPGRGPAHRRPPAPPAAWPRACC